MQRLSKNNDNKYVITLHDDVVTALKLLSARAKRLNKDYLLFLDSFISGAILEHLSEIDAQLQKVEKEQTLKNCENFYKYGTIDAHEIGKIKRGLKNEQ